MQIIAFDKSHTADSIADLAVIGIVRLEAHDDISPVQGPDSFDPDKLLLMACNPEGMWLCIQGSGCHFHVFENQPEIRGKVLCFVGEMLHGADWQSGLVDDLGIGSRSIRYFAAGERYPSEGIIRDALALCADQAQKLQPLAMASAFVHPAG